MKNIKKETSANQDFVKILRRKQLEERLGLSRSTIYSKLIPNPNRPNDYDETFPQPIQLGNRAVGWIESEIDEWLKSKVEQSRLAKGARS